MGVKKNIVHHVRTLDDMTGVMRTAKSPPLLARTTESNVRVAGFGGQGFAWPEYVRISNA